METTTFLDNSSPFVTNLYLSLHCAFGKLYLCIVIRKTSYRVILSETKDLNTSRSASQILHCVQDDTTGRQNDK